MKSFAALKIYLIFIILSSCSSKPIEGDLVFGANSVKFDYDYDFSNLEKTREQVKKIGNLRDQKSQEKLVNLLIAFSYLNSSNHVLKLLPRTRTSVTVASFCASSGRAVPVENEAFAWVRGSPDIKLVRELIDFYHKYPSTDRNKIQTLIWNLENKTNFEDYPEELKSMLAKISPDAKLILPSKVKSRLVEIGVPTDVKSVLDFIEGQYYSAEEFKRHLESIKSKRSLPVGFVASAVPGSAILASTTSDGYEYQTISLYNSSDRYAYLKISDYYLKPAREDVQPVIITDIFPYNEEVRRILENSATQMLGYLISQYPTLNSEEKDLVKKRPIESAIVFYNAMIAEQSAERAYPGSQLNGESDAYRHFVWSGLLTRDVGESTSREFLNAHEGTPGQSVAEKAMDVYNNDRGIRAANELLKDRRFSNEELYGLAKKEIEANRLKIINKVRAAK